MRAWILNCQGKSQMKLIFLVARECFKLQAWRMVYSDEDLRLTSNFIYCAFNVLYILLIIVFKLQLQMRKTKGKNVCGYLPLGESVEELTPAARVTAMETDSEDPKFPDARAAETPESASVEHLTTISMDQDKGKAVLLTKTVWMLLLEPRALLHQIEF
ncbi:uncharacterized protein LOC112024652 [Quercus suber]|uniref:uncharacterized protein LOC112024652 n=1 Tax=Quercus suber TaxID=58331 RepID=UPI0032DE3734